MCVCVKESLFYSEQTIGWILFSSFTVQEYNGAMYTRNTKKVEIEMYESENRTRGKLKCALVRDV